MRKVFIFGSCGSRDAFEFDASKQFQVVEYYARSSIASAFSANLAEDLWSDRLTSPFQKKQVNRDFLKVLPDVMTRSDFDVLLVDLIDERFHLFEFNYGAIVTVSVELNLLRVLTKDMGRFILSDSDERFNLWRIGWDRMVGMLVECGQLDRLIVNRLFWARTGKRLDDEICDSTNATLERMYNHCSRVLSPSQFLDYTPDLLVADPRHTWGHAPFHYGRSLYHETLLQLEKYIVGNF